MIETVQAWGEQLWEPIWERIVKAHQPVYAVPAEVG